MSNRLTILAVVFAALTCGAHAGKTPPPAPNLSASASAQIQINIEQLPPSAPLADATVKFKIAHSFTITAEQEAALQSDAVISLLGISFSPSEDSKFSNGDKSAAVTKEVPAGIIPAPMEAKLKAKWGKGKFTINLSINEKVKDLAIAPFAAKAEDFTKLLNLKKTTRIEGGETRIENVAYITTTISHPSVPDFGAEAQMASDISTALTEGATAEGAQSQGQSQKIQTKFFVIP